MDFVERLLKSQGYSSILIMVDRFSKYADFIPLVHPFTTQSVAQVFMQIVVRLHGLPRTIVIDRDRIFTSHFWNELFKTMGMELSANSSYHPQTNGQIEVTNCTLEQYLQCFCKATRTHRPIELHGQNTGITFLTISLWGLAHLK